METRDEILNRLALKKHDRYFNQIQSMTNRAILLQDALDEVLQQVNSVGLANVGKQRELLLGLLRFERKNGYESTTLVNDEIVDQYLDEL